MTDTATTVELEGIHNFREVAPYALPGGHHLKPGTLYRAGALELMTEADVAFLTSETRLATILDLRHPDEGAPSNHALIDLVAHISVFAPDNSQQAIIEELNGLYGNGPSPERYLHYLLAGGERWVQAFRVLTNPEAYPVLIHCTAGKDRTGVLVGMLMEMVGASDEDIANEYGLSSASIDRLIDYLEAQGRKLEGTRDEIRARLLTPPERMAGFIRLLRERYGSAEGYLLGQGMTQVELDAIKAQIVA